MTAAEAASSGARDERMSPLVVFAWKIAIVSLAVFVTVVATTATVTAIVEASMKDVKLGGSAFWSGLERELEKAASPDRAMPPEKREKLLRDIRAVTAQWRPFVAEVSNAFAGDRTAADCRTVRDEGTRP